MTLEGEVVLGVGWVDILYRHPPLDTAQGEPCRLIGLLVHEYAHTTMLKQAITLALRQVSCFPFYCRPIKLLLQVL